MVSLTEKDKVGQYGIWDLIYFIFFDRWLQLFDVPTLLILFIEGRQWYQKSIARAFVVHAILRNIGGILWAILTYSFQKDTFYWRYNTSFPTLFWYAGELVLDSYPLQKALSLAPNGDKWSILRVLPIVGYSINVVAKVGAVVFRYVYVWKVNTQDDYFSVFNLIDGSVILATTVSDICSCIVIIYVGMSTLRKKRKLLAMDIVTTTELRMFACVCLAVTASCLMFVERCPNDFTSSKCVYNGARDLAINFVYILYYLDYLILKFHNARIVHKFNMGNNNPEKVALSQWPNLGQFGGGRRTLNATASESGPAHGGTGFITSENESPSLRMMRQGAQAKGYRRSAFGIGYSTGTSSQYASDESTGDMYGQYGPYPGGGYPPQAPAPQGVPVARIGGLPVHPKWTQMTTTTPAVSIDEGSPNT